MSEQRQEPRKNVRMSMQLFLFKDNSEQVNASNKIEGSIRDISNRGVGVDMQIDSDEIWEELKNFDEDSTERIYVHLDVLHPEQNIEIVGTLIWCFVTDMENRRLRMGILLDRMDTESLEKWYRFVSGSFNRDL